MEVKMTVCWFPQAMASIDPSITDMSRRDGTKWSMSLEAGPPPKPSSFLPSTLYHQVWSLCLTYSLNITIGFHFSLKLVTNNLLLTAFDQITNNGASDQTWCIILAVVVWGWMMLFFFAVSSFHWLHPLPLFLLSLNPQKLWVTPPSVQPLFVCDNQGIFSCLIAPLRWN